MKLTPKQEKFCELYASLGNATEAAKQAGYSSESARFVGSQNLTKLNIQKRIEELTQKPQEARIADAEEVLTFFSAMMRDKKVQAKDRLRAAENLAKRMGLDKSEKTPQDGNGGVNIAIEKTIVDLSKGAPDD